MTEESLTNGFKDVFGFKCDVLAKILYIQASKGYEDAKLPIKVFYNLFWPFMVSFNYSLD